MTTSPPLSGSHRHTYNAIFQHPLSHNLNWRAVHSLLGKLGEVTEEHNGHLKVTRNGQTLLLHAGHGKDVADPQEVLDLRHFLERSEIPVPDANEKEMHWLLVIDHEEARIFRSTMHGDTPQEVRPLFPRYFRHAQHSKMTSRGKERPDPNTFFEPVAKSLQEAGEILVFGTGTGMSSEMEQFVAWSKHHYPDLAKRIVGSVVIDEHHLSDDQILAKARDFYANAEKSPA